MSSEGDGPESHIAPFSVFMIVRLFLPATDRAHLVHLPKTSFICGRLVINFGYRLDSASTRFRYFRAKFRPPALCLITIFSVILPIISQICKNNFQGGRSITISANFRRKTAIEAHKAKKLFSNTLIGENINAKR